MLFSVNVCVFNLCACKRVGREKKVMRRNIARRPERVRVAHVTSVFSLSLERTHRQAANMLFCSVSPWKWTAPTFPPVENVSNSWWRSRLGVCLCATEWQIWIMSWSAQRDNDLLKYFGYSDCFSWALSILGRSFIYHVNCLNQSFPKSRVLRPT